MNIEFKVLNSGGNVTIFVLTKVDRSQYQSISTSLLDLPLNGEQVAFITGPKSMEMAGLEFCGNATRAFGLLAASGIGEETLLINTSGVDEPVKVFVDTNTDFAEAIMPLPISANQVSWPDLDPPIEGVLVDFGGIIHLVVKDIKANEQIFQNIKNHIISLYNPPALGVMFTHNSGNEMTPIVYVASIDTTFWEGSCGSGTTAVAYTMAKEGSHKFNIKQPAGTLTSTVEMKNSQVTMVTVAGNVDIGPLQQADI